MAEKQFVIDSSAVVAFLRNEKGAEKVEAALSEAVMQMVNLCEVLQFATKHGKDAESVHRYLVGLGIETTTIYIEEALLAASMIVKGGSLGLSLADRICLATGINRSLTVVTADKVWKKLESTHLQVDLIR